MKDAGTKLNANITHMAWMTPIPAVFLQIRSNYLVTQTTWRRLECSGNQILQIFLVLLRVREIHWMVYQRYPKHVLLIFQFWWQTLTKNHIVQSIQI